MSEDHIEQGEIKQRLDDINAISIAIDTYEDIFSDFDPRDILERDLSQDFLNELMHRHRQNRSGKYDVVLVAPRSIENKETEKKIVSRLNKYFHQKYLRYIKTITEIRVRGTIYIVLGSITLMTLTFLSYNKILNALKLELIGIMFLPLGWFGVWEGFSKILDIPFKLDMDTKAYKGLSKASYKFDYLGDGKKQ
jgi:hypothetical protein